MELFDTQYVRAFLAGLAVALVAGPLGCVVVWRRMAYFGDALAHTGLLGVVLAILVGATGTIGVTVGVLSVAVSTALLTVWMERRDGLSPDASLGILAHAALASAVLLLSFEADQELRIITPQPESSQVPIERVEPRTAVTGHEGHAHAELDELLFGDVLATGWDQVAVSWIGGAVLLVILARFWNALVASTLSPSIAAAEGVRPERARLAFAVMIAALVALAIQLVGALLVTALLIVPAATARHLADGPERMAVAAAFLGSIAVALGLTFSLAFNVQAGPAIVVCSVLLFSCSMLLRRS